MAEPPHRLTVADLLHLRRPTTGALSLHFSSASAPAPTSAYTSPLRKKPKLAAAPSSASKPRTAPFTPISHPVLLSGTLSLPSAATPAACRSNCFSFSDPSSSSSPAAASVCCCIVDFDPTALGREIRVLAWNYLPSVHLHGAAGVLEVVRWCLAEEPALAPKPAFLATIPFDGAVKESDLAIRGCVFGVVRSVSAVFSMPLAKPDKGCSSVGFLAELICCGCRQCKKSPPIGDQGHNFEAVKFLYFLESASTWRPVLAWLVGKLVYISGLKKQMVSVKERASYTMLVSSRKTAVAWCPSYRRNVPSDCLPENCGGVYAGVITGIFMQGVVIELDDTVWLLTSNQQLPPPHSIRVGAVISVKNFRMINIKLSWTRIVMLATCSKTSITIKSFSVVDSKIHMKAESRSLLGKFVESLDMPARFWILLLISCFKQKFTKFSDKDILGSQNKQGVVHSYAAKVLSSKCQPQQSLMMTFCSHNCDNFCLESNLEACKLVIPLSNFICKSESLWISMMLEFWNGSKGVGENQGHTRFLCDGVPYSCRATRIISSEDLDLILAGSIKASPLSGRLQLVDSTGSIDVFIPDLPSTESFYGIYEISNYKLALEGPVTYLDHYEVSDPLSCKAVFQQLPYRRKVHHLNIYIIVCWRELNQIGPSSHIPLHVTYSASAFHLLKLTHIFPASSITSYQNRSGPTLYAAAVILPYDLHFIGQGECIEHAEGFRMSHSRLLSNSEASMTKLCKFPCSLSFGSTSLCGILVSSYSSGSGVTVTNEEILLEFKKGTFDKYPSLRIGGCYLLQCPNRNRTAIMENCGCLKGGKFSIDSLDELWSLGITFDGNIGIKETIGDQSTEAISAKMDEPFSRNSIHDVLKLMQPWNDFCHNSYFHLDFSCVAISKDTEEYGTACHILNGLCVSSSEILSVSSCIDILMPKEASCSANMQTEEVVQGDLISLHGKVENVHLYSCKEGSYVPGDEKYFICIHVTDNNHMVHLRGYLSQHSLIGIGPGAMVTFHRILLTQRHELQLTSVTYIEVGSISHADLKQESVISLSSSKCLKHGSLSTILPCLFFHQKHFTANKCMQFHSRVATVLMLVLDSYLNDLQTPELINHIKGPKVKVRLAGFVLDDGSSLCCCWANDARAELMLRLQEVAHLDASVGLKLSKDGSSTNLQLTIGSCLEKMLKKHKSIIVRNYGIPPDFSCGDLEVSSASGKILGRLEEKLLKVITLNACWKGTMNIIASVLNPDDSNGLPVDLPDFYPVRNTQMLWINEVFQVDPLQEAWRLYSDLVNC